MKAIGADRKRSSAGQDGSWTRQGRVGAIFLGFFFEVLWRRVEWQAIAGWWAAAVKTVTQRTRPPKTTYLPTSWTGREEAALEPDSPVRALEPDGPVPFGYKCAWLAIRTDDSEFVVQVLEMRYPRKSNWHEGIRA